MGHCKYILAKDAVGDSFMVVVDNFPCGVDNTLSCTKSVTVHFEKNVIQLKKDSLVNVNGNYLFLSPVQT